MYRLAIGLCELLSIGPSPGVGPEVHQRAVWSGAHGPLCSLDGVNNVPKLTVQKLAIGVVALTATLTVNLYCQTPPRGDPASKLIAEALNDSNASVQSGAIYKLQDIRPTTDEIVLTLVKVIERDPTAFVQGAAVHVIGSVVRSDAHVAMVLPLLLSRLRDLQENLRREATVRVIAEIAPGDIRLRRALVELVQAPHESRELRARAAYGLRGLAVAGNGDVESLRETARTEESAEVRVALWGAITHLAPGDEEAVDALITLARSREDLPGTLRSTAIGILGDTGLVKVLPVLVEALDDVHPQAQAFAALALAKYGPRADSAIPKLVESLRNTPAEGDGPVLRSVMLSALAEIAPTSSEVLDLLQATAEKDPKKQLRDHARRLLVKIGRD